MTHAPASPPTAEAEARTASEAEALFARHRARIHRYCLSQLRSPEDAEDAVQTTFLYAFRALRRGVVPALELAWLLAIARNVCRARHRDDARRAGREAVADLQELEAVLAAPDRDARTSAALTAALARLPESQQRAIVLREWLGCSYSEIGEELGLTPDAVQSLIFRARRSLAENLRADEAATPRRLRAIDVGTFVPGAKPLVAGHGAVKLAAAVAAVAAGTAVVGGPLVDIVQPGESSSRAPVTSRPADGRDVPHSPDLADSADRVIPTAPAESGIANEPRGGSHRGERGPTPGPAPAAPTAEQPVAGEHGTPSAQTSPPASTGSGSGGGAAPALPSPAGSLPALSPLPAEPSLSAPPLPPGEAPALPSLPLPEPPAVPPPALPVP